MMIRLLNRAATEQGRVELIYEAKNKKLTQREVTVYTVTDTHVFCYCHLKNAYRAFALDHILSCAWLTNKRGNRSLIG